VSDDLELRGQIPVGDSDRLEEAWARAIVEGDTGAELEAARAAQARFQHYGVDGLAGLLDSDFELHMHALFLDGRVYRGVEGLRQWRAEIEEVFEYDRFDVRAVRRREDTLVLIGRLYTRGKSSGVEADHPLAYVVKTRGGLIVALTMYSDVERAFADACIS
jgi:ketosteroid isomerase-like protein